MKVKELKEILNKVSDNCDILLCVNRHYEFMNSAPYSSSNIVELKIDNCPCLYISSNSIQNVKELNYCQIEIIQEFMKGRI